jgi:hypothetical protein
VPGTQIETQDLTQDTCIYLETGTSHDVTNVLSQIRTCDRGDRGGGGRGANAHIDRNLT